jgi:hypothetical protein
MVFIEVNLEAARIGSDVTLPSGGLLRSFANSQLEIHGLSGGLSAKSAGLVVWKALGWSTVAHAHYIYIISITAPLLILQENNDPRRRPSPCGEGSVRYMRAFTKAAIVAAV